MMIPLVSEAYAKGLKVNLEVNTNLGSQDVRINAFQSGSEIYAHNEFMNNGITLFDLQYPNRLIENGESFQICVVTITDNLQSCGNGYNSDEKKPENVRVDIISSSTPQPQQQPDQSQSQSQSSNNENNNNVYVCPPEARCYFN
jgi:hypothetical protein